MKLKLKSPGYRAVLEAGAPRLLVLGIPEAAGHSEVAVHARHAAGRLLDLARGTFENKE